MANRPLDEVVLTVKTVPFKAGSFAKILDAGQVLGTAEMNPYFRALNIVMSESKTWIAITHYHAHIMGFRDIPKHIPWFEVSRWMTRNVRHQDTP